MKHRLWALTLAPVLLAGTSGTALAAQGYDSCKGFIDTVPAVITTQGVWCLRADISTAITSGAAITIATNNVTIDCNDFKLGGLGAGPASNALGILALDRLNATVRNCAVRGFNEGIVLFGASGGGHLVEDNRLDGNLVYGIHVRGSGNQVARNRVIDTGGFGTFFSAVGIRADADILDNTVDGVFTTAQDANVIGITSEGAALEIRGNRVRNLLPHGAGSATGIQTSGASVAVMHNRLATSTASAGDVGIRFFNSDPNAYCGGNTIGGFSTPIQGTCVVAGANASD